MNRSMRYSAPRTAAILLALVLAGCASADGGRKDTLEEVLNDARAHPEKRLAYEIECERVMDNSTGNFPYRTFFAGLLAVPESRGGGAFCAALIEAAIAGDFSEADQKAFGVPSEIRGRGPVGALLHVVLEAHERLYATQAQKPPQALSCGCGQ